MDEDEEVVLTFPAEGFAALLGNFLGAVLALALGAGISREEWVEMCTAAFDGVKGE